MPPHVPTVKRDTGTGISNHPGTIIGLIATCIIILLVFAFVLRQRQRSRVAARNRIFTVPAVRQQMMNAYARDQENTIRRVRTGSATRGRASQGGRRVRTGWRDGLGDMAHRDMVETVRRAESRGGTPPPGYYADVAPPALAVVKPGPGGVVR